MTYLSPRRIEGKADPPGSRPGEYTPARIQYALRVPACARACSLVCSLVIGECSIVTECFRTSLSWDADEHGARDAWQAFVPALPAGDALQTWAPKPQTRRIRLGSQQDRSVILLQSLPRLCFLCDLASWREITRLSRKGTEIAEVRNGYAINSVRICLLGAFSVALSGLLCVGGVSDPGFPRSGITRFAGSLPLSHPGLHAAAPPGLGRSCFCTAVLFPTAATFLSFRPK